MENITKITEKLELQDVEVQDYNPCKKWWDYERIDEMDDCLRDCHNNTTPFKSRCY